MMPVVLYGFWVGEVGSLGWGGGSQIKARMVDTKSLSEHSAPVAFDHYSLKTYLRRPVVTSQPVDEAPAHISLAY